MAKYNRSYKMRFASNSKRFTQVLSNPRVYIFIVIGIGIIFFTFLTDNNAVEIAISGFASVFIGIGVNNFSAMETRLKDERKINSKIRHSVKIMEIVHSKICRVHKEVNAGNSQKIMNELKDIEQFIKFGMYIIEDELSTAITPEDEI